MTATDILSRYRGCRAVFGGKSSAWLMLLGICESGDRGLTRSELNKRYSVTSTRLLTLWLAGGLIMRRETPAKGSGAGRGTHTYTATLKAYALLRISPPEMAKLS
jgi:hypothetical protein